MIINLQETDNSLYLRGILTPYTSYWMKLVSKYSNKGILNDEVIYGSSNLFPLTLVDNESDWYSFTIDFTNTDVDDFDIGGYYDSIIYGSNDGGDTLTQINKKLCRVINNWTTLTNYISDNEENGQFTYFRN